MDEVSTPYRAQSSLDRCCGDRVAVVAVLWRCLGFGCRSNRGVALTCVRWSLCIIGFFFFYYARLQVRAGRVLTFRRIIERELGAPKVKAKTTRRLTTLPTAGF